MKHLLILPADYAKLYSLYEKATMLSQAALGTMAEMLTILHTNSETNFSPEVAGQMVEQLQSVITKMEETDDQFSQARFEFSDGFGRLTDMLESVDVYLNYPVWEDGDDDLDEVVQVAIGSIDNSQVKLEVFPEHESDAIEFRIDRHVKDDED